MTAAAHEHLEAARAHLTGAHTALDAAVGELGEPEHGAALEARADLALVIRRVGALLIFTRQSSK